MSIVSTLVRRAERIAARAPKRLAPFLSVGMVGLATHTGVFSLVFHFGLAKSPAWFVGVTISTLVTWQLNRRMTFAASGRRRHAEMLRYALVTAVAQGVSFAVFRALCAIDPAFPPPIALIMGAVFATVVSYTGQRFFTFAPAGAADEADTAAVQEIPVA